MKIGNICLKAINFNILMPYYLYGIRWGTTPTIPLGLYNIVVLITLL